MKFILSLLSIVLMVDSCNSKNNGIDAKIMDQNSLVGNYIITELGDKTITPKTLKISFSEQNEVTGFGGCNSFFGSYTFEKGKISISNVASSKKFCGAEISNTERLFLSALNKSETIEFIDNTLVFSSEGNTILKGVKNSVTKSNKNIALAKPVVIYQTISRGAFNYIKISDTKVSLSYDRNLKTFSDYNCSSSDRDELTQILNKVDLKTISQLKAPTDKRLFDGAPIATLTVISNKEEFTSQSFDHGHPPKEIEAIVNKVLSIKENATKK